MKEITKAPSFCLENPELFNVTRATAAPLESIKASLLDAINEVQKTENMDLSKQVVKIFVVFGDYIDNQLDHTLTRNLLHFVDDLITNYDYYEFVEEFVNNLSD